MNYSAKFKSFIAAASAAAMIIVDSTTAVAASISYGNADDIRMKALNEYLSSAPVVLASNDSEPTIVKLAKDSQSPIGKVTYAPVTEREEVAFDTVKRKNDQLEKGQTVTVREGVPGVKVKTYNVKYVNGVETERELAEEYVETAPVDKIVEYGNKAQQAVAANGGTFTYKYVLTCEATAYDMSPAQNGGYGGITATGVPLDKGVIAVDPKVIPLGSRVYIEALDGSWSYGYAVAADTGGAIKGNRVDLCYYTRSECIQFGRRKCRVYVL